MTKSPKCTLNADGDRITFSSGRTLEIHFGVVGLGEDAKKAEEFPTLRFSLSTGAGGVISYPPNWYALENYEERDPQPGDLTSDDMLELSELMLDRWARFRNSLTP